MNKQAKFLMLALGTALFVRSAMAAPNSLSSSSDSAVSLNSDAKTAASSSKTERVLFKIHDVIPEKNNDGKVIYCDIRATFFNRTGAEISKASVDLGWDDEVIAETIEQEERADREYTRTKSTADKPRYSTAGFTDKVVKLSLKLPPLKSGQQVTLKTKVMTDRCFLLLNDMDINVTNCSMTAGGDRSARGGCNTLFQYVSPKMPEYYEEFKQISLEEQLAREDHELSVVQKEMEDVYVSAIAAIRDITSEVPEETAPVTE